MRAVEPYAVGSVALHGFQVGYEAFGDPAAPAVLLLPCWQIIHSRHWKQQVAYLARHRHVIAIDSAGNGRGERTCDPAAFAYDRIVEQAVALLDHLGVERAAVMGLSRGGTYGLLMAARFPERVERLVLIGSVPSAEAWEPPPDPGFWRPREDHSGWGRMNAHYWLVHYRDWLEFFFGQVFVEPHSTRALEDAVAWGLETTPQILTQTVNNPALWPAMPIGEALARVRCPVLLIHGSDDRIRPVANSRSLAAARPDWELLTIEGAGHAPHLRDPVLVNRAIAGFLGGVRPRERAWRRPAARTAPRALFVSSPIGLGHVQRDLAIARALRRRVPGLTIDWLAQPPVTGVLERAGERIHPLSAALASEAAHFEAQAGEHSLPCFAAYRAMDEIMLANFMIFLEAAQAAPYSLWVGDEAWELDYYLHENPQLKAAPYVWLADFVGWLPMDRRPGSREALLTADYNAEMLAQVARRPRVRDLALYIGDYEDLIPERFGPGLPPIPDWTREHFQAVGYIAPFDPADLADVPAQRARLGYPPGGPLVVVAAGGTAVGRHLLARVSEAWPHIRRERPDARCVVVAGPRVDPGGLARTAGLELRRYVHNLYEHLAVADLGIVQGGLSTTMELTVARRPFLYFPLAGHCEQRYHVAYRLDRYRAGVRMEYAATSARDLAAAALGALGAPTGHYRRHAPGAAERAAELIAGLL